MMFFFGRMKKQNIKQDQRYCSQLLEPQTPFSGSSHSRFAIFLNPSLLELRRLPIFLAVHVSKERRYSNLYRCQLARKVTYKRDDCMKFFVEVGIVLLTLWEVYCFFHFRVLVEKVSRIQRKTAHERNKNNVGTELKSFLLLCCFSPLLPLH